jgi:hypothetical protein
LRSKQLRNSRNDAEECIHITLPSCIFFLRSPAIDFKIDNVNYTSSLITFDIDVNPSGQYLYDALIDVSYNPYNFGTNVQTNGKLSCTAGSDFTSNYDFTGPSDVSGGNNDKFTLGVSGNVSSINGNTLSGPGSPSLPYANATSYIILASCSLQVQNCCLAGNPVPYLTISSAHAHYSTTGSIDDGMGNYTATEDDGNSYGTGTMTGYDNGGSNLCGGSTTPTIGNISPTTISAGTFSVLTISGSGFGCDPGVVYFTCSEPNISPMMHTQPQDIKSWSDNIIMVLVPSVQDEQDGHAAGSGSIVVQTATGISSSPSVDQLHIPYAALNIRISSTDTRPVYAGLKNQNGTGGYTFTPDDLTIPNSPNNLPSITNAMSDWICETGINLTMGSGTSITGGASSSDGINSITFGVPDLGAAAETHIGLGGICTNSSGELVCPALDIDIVFNKSLTYDLTTFTTANTTATNTSGLYSLLDLSRHEFGHVGLLRENLNLSDVMYYRQTAGANPGVIQNEDQNGGIYILTDVGPNHLVSSCVATYSA